jgi:hypothetical protein
MNDPATGSVESSRCPGCGETFEVSDGPVHRYMTSTPGCWRAFGELLAADYSSPERMDFHQLVVDAYAAQHPGDDGPQQIQSVGLHLMTMCLFLEHDTDPALGTSLHRKMIGRPTFTRVPRSGPGTLSVRHVPVTGRPNAARTATYEWASAVWNSYAGAHATVRRWLREVNCLPG